MTLIQQSRVEAHFGRVPVNFDGGGLAVNVVRVDARGGVVVEHHGGLVPGGVLAGQVDGLVGVRAHAVLELGPPTAPGRGGCGERRPGFPALGVVLVDLVLGGLFGSSLLRQGEVCMRGKWAGVTNAQSVLCTFSS